MGTFPDISGQNINGQTFSLPDDFEGIYNLIFVGFNPMHQVLINTWLPTAVALSQHDPRLRCYEIPVLAQLDGIQRQFVNMSMKRAITDPFLRESTIALYTDIEDFTQIVGLPTIKTAYPMLVSRTGDIIWKSSGLMTDEKLRRLLQVLELRGFVLSEEQYQIT